MDIVLEESDCRLALSLSSFVHDLHLQHAPYLMPYIKPWLYMYSECCYDDHLLPTMKLCTAGASENGNRATVYIVEKLETPTVIVTAGVDFQLEIP